MSMSNIPLDIATLRIKYKLPTIYNKNFYIIVPSSATFITLGFIKEAVIACGITFSTFTLVNP